MNDIHPLILKEFNRRVFNESVVRIGKMLDMLDEEQVWVRSNDQSNSVGHLILHLCGNVTQWIGSGIGKKEDLRQRDEEFSTNNKRTKSELKELLNNLSPIVQEAFSIITTDNTLKEYRKVQGFQESVVSIIIHVMEHFSYHTGQIAVITKSLTNRDLGFYTGIDLNAKN